MYTQYTIFIINKIITPDYSKSADTGFFSLGTQEGVPNSCGKRVIGVRATEVLLYIVPIPKKQILQCVRKFLSEWQVVLTLNKLLLAL